MLGVTTLLVLASLLGGPAAASVGSAGGQPAAVVQDYKTADDLLDALETADKDLSTLTADVKYDKTFEIQGDRQVRFGRLWFVSEPAAKPDEPPRRKFAIKFDRVFIGPVQRTEDKTYIFDGQWMMEKDAVEKFFQKKQVVGPGAHFDPLKVGEGPFVLPIGQRKADIKDRYNVELLPSDDGLEPSPDSTPEEREAARVAKEDVSGSWQLRLTPRNKVDDDGFTDIRLWYKRGAQRELLPRMARTVNPAGDVASVLLINVQVQLTGGPPNEAAKVPPEILDTATPQGWEGQVTPWRKRDSAQAPAREGSDAGDK